MVQKSAQLNELVSFLYFGTIWFCRISNSKLNWTGLVFLDWRSYHMSGGTSEKFNYLFWRQTISVKNWSGSVSFNENILPSGSILFPGKRISIIFFGCYNFFFLQNFPWSIFSSLTNFAIFPSHFAISFKLKHNKS